MPTQTPAGLTSLLRQGRSLSPAWCMALPEGRPAQASQKQPEQPGLSERSVSPVGLVAPVSIGSAGVIRHSACLVLAVLIFFLAGIIIPNQAQGQGLSGRVYVWVDDAGQRHFSDHPPAVKTPRSATASQQAGASTIGPLSTDTRPQASSSRLARRDQALLSSYDSEEDLKASHSRALQALDQSRGPALSNMDRMNRMLDEIRHQLEAVVDSNDVEAIDDWRGRLAKNTIIRDQQQAELDKLNARRDGLLVSQTAELERFRFLTNTDADEPLHSGAELERFQSLTNTDVDDPLSSGIDNE